MCVQLVQHSHSGIFTDGYSAYMDTVIEIGDLLTCTPMSQLCSHIKGWYDGGILFC